MRAAIMAGALLVGACQGADTGAAANEAVAADTQAAAGPSVPEAVPAAPAKAAEAVLTSEGFGPLRIGMTRAEVVAALGEDSDPEAVGGPDPESCDEFTPARAPEGLLVMVEEGRVSRISLTEGSGVKTDRGLGIGAPASEVRAAYGAALVAEPHKYAEAPAEYLTIWAGGAKPAAYVEDPAARGLRYVVETGGKVATIHAGGPSIQYVEGCA
ncbi:MAG TPA: hypothetical protein VF582_05130 [Allosphingosinicella sp.]|jgi:hypothetical protein